MTSADLAAQILNWDGPGGSEHSGTGAYTALSVLIQSHHDAIVDECARVAQESAVSLLKHERAAVAKAVGAIRALKGCA